MPSGAAMGTRVRERTRASKTRGDIQGLRAVAVLTVFADHLFGWPSGGFIGVDVFFVISGFLITGILVREFEKTGHISFSGFYTRRVRRILPAAVATLLVTVLFSYVLFPASKAGGVLWDAIASFFFVGNWRFAATGTDYFAQGTPSPLQHFWSLSVEEQFYFVWPWLMLAILLIGVRVVKGSVRSALRVAGGLMLFIVLASFVFALFQSVGDPTVAYFSTLTRVWELGIGALLAIFGAVFARIPMGARIGLAWGGLVTIGVGLFVITPEVPFPAPWAAVPVLGAAMVIAAGIGEEPRANVLLTNPASRYIGDISYSLYLWHWPVIILGAAMFPEQGLLFYIGASIMGFVLAIVSYEIIERPMTGSPLFKRFSGPAERASTWSSWSRVHADRVRLVAVAVLLPAAVSILALIFIFPPGGLSAEQVARIEEANRQHSTQRTGGGSNENTFVATGELNQRIHDALSLISWPQDLHPTIDTVQVEGMPEEDAFHCSDPESTQCEFGVQDAPTIVVYGDSLGTTLLPTVRAAYERDHRIKGLTQASCAVTDLDVLWKSDIERDNCLAVRANIRALVAEERPDVVLVIQNYKWFERLLSQNRGVAAGSEWLAADRVLRDELLAAGAGRVVFVSAPPEGKSIIDCATQSPVECVSAIGSYWGPIRSAESSLEGSFLDQSDWFCAEGECPVIDGATIVRRDHIHPTRQYAAEMAGEFRQRLDELIAAE